MECCSFTVWHGMTRYDTTLTQKFLKNVLHFFGPFFNKFFSFLKSLIPFFCLLIFRVSKKKGEKKKEKLYEREERKKKKKKKGG